MRFKRCLKKVMRGINFIVGGQYFFLISKLLQLLPFETEVYLNFLRSRGRRLKQNHVYMMNSVNFSHLLFVSMNGSFLLITLILFI